MPQEQRLQPVRVQHLGKLSKQQFSLYPKPQHPKLESEWLCASLCVVPSVVCAGSVGSVGSVRSVGSVGSVGSVERGAVRDVSKSLSELEKRATGSLKPKSG